MKKFDENMPEKITFFEKANVNGPETREVFSFLKKNMPNSDGSTEITWNFGKLLATAVSRHTKH